MSIRIKYCYGKSLKFILFLVFFPAVSYTQNAFISTWKTDNPGTSNNTSITIPTSGGGYNYQIDWNNDGVYDEFGINGGVTHDFGTAGTYTIRIDGDFPRIRFEHTGDAEKIIDIEQWGDIAWTSMFEAFDGCTNLNVSATDAPDLSNVTSMTLMFLNCSNFDADINHWDVGNVEEFNGLFWNTSFNRPLDNWNVSNALSMGRMFAACPFNQNISGWDMSNVTSTSRMFAFNTAFNQNIGGWNMGSNTSMLEMFRSATAFNHDIGAWDVSKVTTMSFTFFKAESFDQDISAWDVGSVEDMRGMFAEAIDFNQNISAWDVSSVTDMSLMFNKAIKFNQPLNTWNVGNVTDMSSMFQGAAVFNQPLAQWNVGNVINMNSMFWTATDFDQDIGGWDVNRVKSIRKMFGFTDNFNRDIGSWQVDSVTDMSQAFHSAKVFDQDIGNWETNSVTDMSEMFRSALVFDRDIGGWNVGRVTDMSDMFNNAEKFNQDLNSWDVSNVTDMSYMFSDAENFNQPLDGWEVVQVENMEGLFYQARQFDQPLTNWDVSNSTNMRRMFMRSVFDQDIGDWDVSVVANMEEMFRDVTLSTENYDSLLIGWNKLNLQNDVDFHGGNSVYCAGGAAKTGMVNDFSWVFTDGGSEKASPTAVCKDVTLQLGTDGTLSISASSFDDGSLDLCTAVSFAATRTSFDCDDVGTAITNILTVTDGNANSSTCTANVTILPSLDISCPSDIVVTVASSSSCEARASWTVPTPSCSSVSFTSSHDDGDLFPVGQTSVSYTAQDNFGNSNQCTFEVTVLPFLEISCPPDINMVTNIAACSARVTWAEPVVNCGSALTSSHKSGDTFPLGTTTVTYALTDFQSNTINCSFDVIVANGLSIQLDSLRIPSCFDFSNGQAFVTVSGGIAPYNYDWNYDDMGDNDDIEDQSGLKGGDHIVQVTDQLGCNKSDTITIAEPLELALETDIIELPNVNGKNIDLTVTGGEPPYSFKWTEEGSIDFSSEEDITVSKEGVFAVTVTDANGCLKSIEVSVNCDNFNFDIYPNPNQGVFTLAFESCYDDAMIEIFDLLGRAVYTLFTSDLVNTIELNDLPEATYLIRISTEGKTIEKLLVIGND